MQPRPCQPTWITLPSSTNTGTVRTLLSIVCMRARASGSASTSYSRKSRLVHSSPSRNSCVYGHRALPESSRVVMVQHLQHLPQYVIRGCLYLLYARDIVTANNDGVVCQPAAIDLS